MILNPEKIQNKKAVGEVVARYLIYDCGLPVLAIDDGLYWFTDNERFRECVKNMPMFLRIFYSLGLLDYW